MVIEQLRIIRRTEEINAIRVRKFLTAQVPSANNRPPRRVVVKHTFTAH